MFTHLLQASCETQANELVAIIVRSSDSKFREQSPYWLDKSRGVVLRQYQDNWHSYGVFGRLVVHGKPGNTAVEAEREYATQAEAEQALAEWELSKLRSGIPLASIAVVNKGEDSA